MKHQFHRLLSTVFYDPRFDLGLRKSEESLHVVFVLQELHFSQMDAKRCRDEVHPKNKSVKRKCAQSLQTASAALLLSRM